MRNFTSFTQLVMFLLVCSFSAQATHFNGNEIWHTYIGNDQYQIFAGQYMNCSGAASQTYLPIGLSPNTPAVLGITYATTSSCVTTVDTTWQIILALDVTPLCPGISSNCTNTNSPVTGIAYFVHKQTISITNCGSGNPKVTVQQDVCCRPSSITSGAGNDEAFIEHDIYPLFQSSSPQLSPVALTVCDGQQASFYLGGNDPDFDSLNYSLVPALQSLGFPVGYSAGFSAAAPLGSGWTVNLNSQTGVLECIPSPGGIQTGVVAVRIDEFRGGQLVGTTIRDLIITVTFCGNSNTPPIVDGISNMSGGTMPSPNVIDYCLGSTLSFDLTISDPNLSQNLTATQSIQQTLPGSQVVMTGTNPLVLSVTWTSSVLDTANRSFHVSAIDNACSYPGKTTDVFFLTPKGKCIDAAITGTNCQDSTGAIAISVGGATGPFSYLWSNGATTPVLSNLTIGSYTVTVLDSSTGAVFSDTFLLTADDIILNSTVVDPDCNGPSGAIYLGATGGQGSYTYAWNTGATGDSLINLSPGGYSVIVTDSIGCFQQGVFVLDPPDSCFVTISGQVYHDANGNCMADSGEVGLSGILLNFTPGGMVLTDSNGYYSFLADTGLTTVKVVSSYLNGAICPDSQNVSSNMFGSSFSSINFGVDTILFQDLAINLHSGPAIWNGQVKYTLVAFNNGTLPTSGATKTLNYPAGLMPTGFFPAPSSIDTVNNIITWNTGFFAPSQFAQCWAYFALDSTLNLNDSLFASASIGILGNEVDTLNNFDIDTALVVGSYDPNDKQVSPAGIDSAGFILQSTSTLDYTIRFQNTGNFPASFVVLRDTLSPFLDLVQYNTLGFSHPFALTVEEDSIMVFTFANINLPDSMTDPLGSQGFVEFQLGVTPNLPVGTEINNQAAIYFDFNPPIFTNTVLNTIYTQLDVELTEDSLYCIGDPIFANLIATGKPPYTFDWSFGGPSTTNDTSDVTLIFQTGWYVVTVTDAFGFSDTDSVLVIPEPGAFADFEWELTGNGFEVAFTDSSQNGASYFWDFGNGDTSTLQNPVVVYTQTGEYIVKFAVTNICGTDTSTQTISINNDGIDSWPFEPISVQPNPFTRSTSVLFPRAGNWSLKIYDLRGKVVYQESVSGASITIQRGSLSDGIYYLEVNDGEHWDRRKILIRD